LSGQYASCIISKPAYSTKSWTDSRAVLFEVVGKVVVVGFDERGSLRSRAARISLTSHGAPQFRSGRGKLGTIWATVRRISSSRSQPCAARSAIGPGSAPSTTLPASRGFRALLDRGCDFEADILPTVTRTVPELPRPLKRWGDAPTAIAIARHRLVEGRGHRSIASSGFSEGYGKVGSTARDPEC
jgi:hypothetical protein